VEGEAYFNITTQANWVYVIPTLLKKKNNSFVTQSLTTLPKGTFGSAPDRIRSVHRSAPGTMMPEFTTKAATDAPAVTYSTVRMQGGVNITPIHLLKPSELNRVWNAMDIVYADESLTGAELAAAGARSRKSYSLSVNNNTPVADIIAPSMKDNLLTSDRIVKYQSDDYIFTVIISYADVGVYDLTAKIPVFNATTNRGVMDIVPVVFRILASLKAKYPTLTSNILEIGNLILTSDDRGLAAVTKHWPLLVEAFLEAKRLVALEIGMDSDSALRGTVIKVPRSISDINALALLD
jgi:hypothetical protein